MKPKELLSIAEDYASMRGDDEWFRAVFEKYRAFENVRTSVKMTLTFMYGTDVCEMLTEGV
jgi:hypothetical protein